MLPLTATVCVQADDAPPPPLWDPDDSGDGADDDDTGVVAKPSADAVLMQTNSTALEHSANQDGLPPRQQQHTPVVDSSEIVRRRQEARRQTAVKLQEAKQQKARRLRALEPRVSAPQILTLAVACGICSSEW